MWYKGYYIDVETRDRDFMARIGVKKVSLRDRIEKYLEDKEKSSKFVPSVVRLCWEHQQEVTKELNDLQKVPSIKQVTMLFGKPVIEESLNIGGKQIVKCIICGTEK